MIKVKNITVKNFMSVGNTTQAINFDRNDLTLVLGENLDLGGDGSRNGTGKTTIINALSYALYGQALTNIKKDNLINKTNNKNMLVSLEFSIDDIDYRIERGRKPAALKFYVNDAETEQFDDNAQGDSRETQHEIEKVLGMSHDMFQHILALNTYAQPFLSLRANDQRAIIEQLLGITVLSERANTIKELAKQTKDEISQESMRINAIQEANKRIEQQIESIKQRSKAWNDKKQADLKDIASAIESLSHVNIDEEIENHRLLTQYKEQKEIVDNAERWAKSIEQENTRLSKQISTIENEIKNLENHQCYACGQDLHDAQHENLLSEKQKLLAQINTQLEENIVRQKEHAHVIDITNIPDTEPTVFYSTLDQAYEHQSSLSALYTELERRNSEEDPYISQIAEMQVDAVQEVSYDRVNELTRLQEHQDFLIKLLTNKDSFVRKKIIDQNLSYLNTRLSHYLDSIGLPHRIIFQNDLSVEITELGRDLDFDNLSRGERTRLIFCLSLSFRDMWESLYKKINLLFIDELIDSGMDSAGVENSLLLLEQMSRERSKSVWLVSHKEELIGRVENVLNVVKTNGFTEYREENM